jgi:predicted acylesterase/phospholipase RssA
MAPFHGRPPNVLVLGGGGLLGEAWMTGVLARYEDATGADVRRCRRFVGTSAGSIVASSLVAGRSPRRPGSAKAGATRPVEDPGGAPSPSAGPDREGRQVPNIVVGAGAVAARLGAPIRALALRVLPEGRRSIAAFGDEVDRWGATFDGRLRVCTVDAGNGRRVVVGSRSAPPASVGQAVAAPARSRRSSRRCASVTDCASTAAPGRQQTPMPRPPDVAIACCCSSRTPCSSEARCGERPCSRPSRSGAVAPW